MGCASGKPEEEQAPMQRMPSSREMAKEVSQSHADLAELLAADSFAAPAEFPTEPEHDEDRGEPPEDEQDAPTGTAESAPTDIKTAPAKKQKQKKKKKKVAVVPVITPNQAHMPPLRDVHASAKKRMLWAARDGKSIEPILRSGAIALLDAEWVVKLAANKGVLAPRQLLPPEAFATVEEVIAATTDGDPFATSLPIICISYPWLTPDHPDPFGENLAKIGKALRLMLAEEVKRCPRYFVMWDWASLHQHQGRPENGKRRLEMENVLFKQALDALMPSFYSHASTTVWMLTKFPKNYLAAPRYKKRLAAHAKATGMEPNTSQYAHRGWCFTESSVAAMVKGTWFLLDLGRVSPNAQTWSDMLIQGRYGRRPPLTPADFAAELKQKKFTNGKDDHPLVEGMYQKTYGSCFRKTWFLDYRLLNWGDAEAKAIAALLQSGATPNLRWLRLFANGVGPEGMKAVVRALANTKKVTHVQMFRNQMGDAGLMALAEALAADHAFLPRLREVQIAENGASDQAKAALKKAVKARHARCVC